MASANKFDWMKRGYPPGFIASNLVRQAQGGDRDAGAMIQRIMQTRRPDAQISGIQDEMRAITGHAIVSGDPMSAIPLDPANAMQVGLCIPRKIVMAALCIIAAKNGNPKAQAAMRKMLNAARAGDVKAKANVATLQAAMPIVGYYESIVASLTELAGDNLGKSLYSMFKAFDPTRSENKAMRTLWQVVPGGGAALTAVDSAAMVNNAVNAAKKAVPTPVKPAAAQAKPAPAPAKVIVAPIANQPKPVIVNDEKLRAVSDAILDDMVKAALNGTGYADMRPDQMVPMLPALIKEQKRRADLRALVQSPALQAYNPAPATPEGRRRWYSPKRRGLYANGAGL